MIAQSRLGLRGLSTLRLAFRCERTQHMAEPLRPDETLAVAIVLYDEVEELDFCGPFETFSMAAVLSAGEAAHRERPAFSVFTVAERGDLVKTGGGLRIQPNYSFQTAPPVDIVLVPGGDTRPQLENTALLEWLKQATAHARLSTSVCTGAFLLGKLGLLEGVLPRLIGAPWIIWRRRFPTPVYSARSGGSTRVRSSPPPVSPPEST